MDNIFDKFRSGAGKAAFEADKLRRITATQNMIRSLKGDFEKEVEQVGHTAFSLYQRQQISQPELVAACGRLAAVLSQIQAREREIEAIRAEAFEDHPGQPQYGRICPNGHGPIPQNDNFCQKCGARAIEVPPPSGRRCPNCGTALATEARFCASCGQPIASIHTTPLKVANACPACGTPLLPDALFCAECGHHLAVDAQGPTPEEEAPDHIEQVVRADTATVLEEPEPARETRQELFMDFGDFEFTAEDAETVEGKEAETAFAQANPAEEEGIRDEHSEEETAVDQQTTHSAEEMPIDPANSTEQIVNEPTVCPICHTEPLPGALFCAECGHRLGSD